ncbi:hypothetical protein [Ornithinibacillus sp. JPR2-1]|uniref:hypothetical protein n=1 Tax=Ornithinibacillus sp. JPR2-1 TaxID=2094019 RepID=UPI0031DFCF43
MSRKNKIVLSLIFSVLVILLSGCSGSEKLNHYYLLLAGESQTWNLSDYEVVLTPEDFKAGYGTLQMKNSNEYISDSFRFETHVVINGEDIIVHSSSFTGPEIDIAEETTGAMESGPYLDENGSPITLNEISNIYMMVEWWDVDKRESMNERIDLFTKSTKEQTFFN